MWSSILYMSSSWRYAFGQFLTDVTVKLKEIFTEEHPL